MLIARRLSGLVLTAFLGLAFLPGAALAQLKKEPKLQVRLLANVEAIHPGTSFDAALAFEIEEGWHIYWKNSGDTGKAPQVTWHLPEGFAAGELRFPAPQPHRDAADLLSYILEGEPILTATLTPPNALAPAGPVSLKADIKVLVCQISCVMLDRPVQLELPVVPSADSPKAANAELFQAAQRTAPIAPQQAKYATVKPVVNVNKIRPGDEVQVGVVVDVQKGWHIQSHTPLNEFLVSTELFPEHTAALDFGRPAYPEHKVRTGPGGMKLAEYDGAVLIRFTAKADNTLPPGPMRLAGVVRYQACNEAGQCFPPQHVAWSVELPVGAPGDAVEHLNREYFSEGPRTSETVTAERPVDPGRGADRLQTGAEPAGSEQVPAVVAAEGSPAPPSSAGAAPALDFADGIPWQPWYPGIGEKLAGQGRIVYIDYTASWCLTCQLNKKVVLETAVVRQRMQELQVYPVKADYTKQPPEMHADLERFQRAGVPLNLIYFPQRATDPIVLPEVLTQSIVLGGLDAAAQGKAAEIDAVKAEAASVATMLLFAVIGGLILNIMPCVLPVISIKILSFVQQAGENRKRVLALGLAFAGGIMTSFLLLAVLVVVLKQAGQSVGWGFQLANPWVVILMAGVVFVFGLSLFGVFEVNLPGRATSTLSAAERGEGLGGSFMKGVLATVLATPCTAPFLGSAIGWGFVQKPLVVVSTMLCVGLGMALPYVLLTAQPAWMKYLPRPGTWMIRFKQFMGFLLMGTVVWLLWVLKDLLDAAGVVWTLVFLCSLAMAAWLLGMVHVSQSMGRQLALWAAAAGVVLLGGAITYGVYYDVDAAYRPRPVAMAPLEEAVGSTVRVGALALEP